MDSSRDSRGIDVPESPCVAERSEKEDASMKSTTIAVDVAKEVLEVAVSVRPGQVSEQKRLSRAAFTKFCTDQPPATVLLEACGSAHYWGRRLQSLGHHVVLLPPHATRPYVFRNKTDRTDTRGLLEAFRNEDIHPVPVKSVPQQALTALHRLRSIPGVGLITATALVAFVGDVQRFPSGRHFASYLGLTPRERSSGLVRRLGSISKRGDVYLRMLLIHGARAVLWAAKKRPTPDRLRAWALHLQTLRGHNKAAIALANKLARIVWAVWKHDVDFREEAA